MPEQSVYASDTVGHGGLYLAAMDNSTSEGARVRRRILAGIGIGLGGLLAFGGTFGVLRFFTGSRNRSPLLLRRRTVKPGLPSKDSIFYPRDPYVRSKLSERHPRT